MADASWVSDYLVNNACRSDIGTYVNTSNPAILNRQLLYSVVLVLPIRFGILRSYNFDSIISATSVGPIISGRLRLHDTGLGAMANLKYRVITQG